MDDDVAGVLVSPVLNIILPLVVLSPWDVIIKLDPYWWISLASKFNWLVELLINNEEFIDWDSGLSEFPIVKVLNIVKPPSQDCGDVVVPIFKLFRK